MDALADDTIQAKFACDLVRHQFSSHKHNGFVSLLEIFDKIHQLLQENKIVKHREIKNHKKKLKETLTR